MCPKSGNTEEAQLKSAQFTKFERILVAATDGIVTLDKEGRYTYANAAAEKILGVPRELILQRTFDLFGRVFHGLTEFSYSLAHSLSDFRQAFGTK